MVVTKTNFSVGLQYLKMVLIVVLSCFALFSLDKGTHAVSDLFKPLNLAALVVYFTPAFISSLILFRHFSKKYNAGRSLMLALIMGIPLGFTLVISLFLLFRS